MDENIDKFIEHLRNSLSASTFVKLSLGNYKGSEPHLQKVSVRLIETKRGRQMLFQYRHDTRDVVKNLPPNDGVAEVGKLLSSGFRSGHLFTTANDFQLDIGKRSSRLNAAKPTFKKTAITSHDRQKKTLIDPNAFYLKALGIATEDGKIRAPQQDKWRQINKFVEILAELIDSSNLKNNKSLNIVDMGSGKGYLTFAAYDFLTGRNAAVEERASDAAKEDSRVPIRRALVTGVEQRPDLVDLCNQIARAGRYDGLNFVEGTIADFDGGEADILIALHACDTATDDAMFNGIAANASIIIAAPCCHKEIRRQIKPPEMLAGVLKHGVLLERTAESLTDGLRSLLLEREGYKTKMIEFVPTEHTPKNNLLVAVRQGRNAKRNEVDAQIKAVMNEFHISDQRLYSLLSAGS